jgi:2-isopropylmalate synthase
LSRPPDESLIYDWNAPERSTQARARPVSLLDDTLRDGLQSTAVRQPSLDERSALLRAMAKVGVHTVNLGLPAASPSAASAIARLTRDATELGLGVVVAGRTLVSDMQAIVELAERTGVRVEGHAFVGSSALRAKVEGWGSELVEERTAAALGVLARAGLPAAFVSEDTTRSHPDTLRALFTVALDAGATRLCLCDTVGHATPGGVHRLVAFTRAFLAERAAATNVTDPTYVTPIALDWHGHADRGLSLANALAALDAGVDRVHGTALGLGERAGNTALELLILNLYLAGRWPSDLVPLADYCRLAAQLLGVAIPPSHPLVGEGAFRTATGVHAAAIRKALKQADWLSDRVYGAVPAGAVGRAQELCIGPLSGRANVEHWLSSRGLPLDEALIERVLAYARSADHVLSDREIERFVSDRDEP